MTDLHDGSLFGPDQPCFGCAPDHPAGFQLRFEKRDEEIVTLFTPSERYQGPPGIMHGGLVATLADEIGAWSLILLLEKFGFTAEMSGKLHRPVRVGVELEGRGRIEVPGTRVVGVGVRLTQDDVLVYTGSLRFVLLDRRGAERMLGGPLPETWERFAR